MTDEKKSVDALEEVIAKLQNMTLGSSQERSSKVPMPVGIVLSELGRYIKENEGEDNKAFPWDKVSKTLRLIGDIIDTWYP